MKTVKHESHTADVQIEVEADSLEELFEGSLEGMNSILKENIPDTVEEKESIEIDITSLDVRTLLIDFLSEVLTDSYVKKKIFTRIEFLELKTHFIKANIYGIAVDSFDDELKALNYHMAKVEKSPSGKWKANIVFEA
jgi:SHS2 domain-containing protein